MSEKLICARCKLPILKGTLYTKTGDGKLVHLKHTFGAIGDAIDDGGSIGFGEDPPMPPTTKDKKES